MLYLTNAGIACREGCGLAYTSQREEPGFRHLKRALEILARVGGGRTMEFPSFPSRPPHGMHRKTFDRLRQEYLGLLETALGLES